MDRKNYVIISSASTIRKATLIIFAYKYICEEQNRFEIGMGTKGIS